MKLTVKNFRCWTEKTIIFKKHPITLLKGKTESGKSTLFEAVSWVMFGGGKVSPILHPNSKTVVKLQLKHKMLTPIEKTDEPIVISVIIERKNKPKEVSLKYKGLGPILSFASVEAEQVIQLLYGSKEIWRFTCYSPQGLDTIDFFGANDFSRFNYLYSIAFDGNDSNPNEDREKTTADMSRLKTSLDSLDIKLGECNKRLDRFKYTDTHSSYRTKVERVKIEKEIPLLEKQEKKALVDQQLNLTNNTKYNSIAEKLEKLVEPKLVTLDKVDSNLSDTQIYSLIDLIQERNSLLSKFDSCKYEELSSKVDTTVSLTKLKQDEKDILTHKKVCSTYNIEYNSEAISKRLSTVLSILESSKLCESYKLAENQVNSIKRSLNSLVRVDKVEIPMKPTLVDRREELLNLTHQISRLEEEIKLANSVIVCPECKTNLHYNNKQLTVHKCNLSELHKTLTDLKSSKSFLDNKSKIERKEYDNLLLIYNTAKTSAKNYEVYIQKYDNLTLQLQNAETNLAQLTKPDFNTDFDQLRKEYKDLSVVKVIILPNFTSKELEELLSLTAVNSKLVAVNSKLTEFLEIDLIDSRLIDTLKLYIKYRRDFSLYKEQHIHWYRSYFF